MRGTKRYRMVGLRIRYGFATPGRAFAGEMHASTGGVPLRASVARLGWEFRLFFRAEFPCEYAYNA